MMVATFVILKLNRGLQMPFCPKRSPRQNQPGKVSNTDQYKEGFRSIIKEIKVTIKRLSETDSNDDVQVIEDSQEIIKPKVKNKKNKIKPIKELTKHYNNIKKILDGSNATPIHGRNDIGYMCCYCTEQYSDPADLKVHTLEKHKDTANVTATFLKKRDLKKYHVKVDITGLKCKMCDEPLNDLEDLMSHLKNEHNRKIFTDVKNHIVPFKFEHDELKCFICSDVFTKFKMLYEHMHKHCRNFICNLCDSGFVNRRSLLNHEKIHELGEFKCKHCEKVFNSIQKKYSHERTVHVHGYLLNKCGYCNQKFPGYRSKAVHMKTVHGIGLEPIKCQACEKTFCNKDSIRKHVKRHHLMESRFSCSECDMKFYGSKELTEHMVKHTKTRSYQCHYCLKWYGRKNTLREHMRIHENDRRFKCDHCGIGFVQKCSWRRHMVVKHGEKV